MRAERKGSFTKAKQVAFLDHLATTGNVSSASRAVGFSPQTAYAMRRRDPLFAARWNAALESAYAVLEAALLARALGTDGDAEDARPMPDGSGAMAQSFDPDLALRLLGRRAPVQQRTTGPREVDARMTSKQVTIEEVEASVLRKLDAIEKRRATTV